MAYDEDLADRVLAAVADDPDISTRKMFGGWAVMLRGNMLAGVIGDDLMVRVGPTDHEKYVNQPGAREMDFTGRPMRGMLLVDGSSVRETDRLEEWLGVCQEFVGELPAK